MQRGMAARDVITPNQRRLAKQPREKALVMSRPGVNASHPPKQQSLGLSQHQSSAATQRKKNLSRKTSAMTIGDAGGTTKWRRPSGESRSDGSAIRGDRII